MREAVELDDGSVMWHTTGNLTLDGFSHGTAGIALGLARLAGRTGESRFGALAGRAILGESRRYDAGLGGWPDRRRASGERVAHTTWCHGSAGIGLSRLGLLRTAVAEKHQATVRRDLERAMVGVLASRPRLDHLCCGTAGETEFLLALGRELGEAEASGGGLRALRRGGTADPGRRAAPLHPATIRRRRTRTEPLPGHRRGRFDVVALRSARASVRAHVGVSAQRSVADLLRFLEPELSAAVGATATTAIVERAESLPLDPFRLVGLELPLSGTTDDCDLLLQLGPAVALRRHFGSPVGAVGAGGELRDLLAALSDPADVLFGAVADAWLEYDVGSGDGRRPSLFASPARSLDTALALARRLRATGSEAGALERLIERFGDGDRVQQLGVMHGRARRELRCVVSIGSQFHVGALTNARAAGRCRRARGRPASLRGIARAALGGRGFRRRRLFARARRGRVTPSVEG